MDAAICVCGEIIISSTLAEPEDDTIDVDDQQLVFCPVCGRSFDPSMDVVDRMVAPDENPTESMGGDDLVDG